MKNYKNQGFIFIQMTFCILLLLSLFKSSFTIGNITFKPVNIFCDIIVDENKPGEDSKDKAVVESPKTQKQKQIEILLKDSLKINLDSLKLAEQNDLRITDFRQDSAGRLVKFFKAISDYQQGKRKTVRIAYFGDSMIEGDLITQTLRNGLQSIFGGEGVGFVPITSNVAGFRRTILHSFSSDWQTHSVLKKTSNKRYGISGFVFNPRPVYQVKYSDSAHLGNYSTSWVSYLSPRNSYFNLRQFHTVKLYYGKGSDNSYITYSVDGVKQTRKLDGKAVVNEVVLNEKNPANSLKIHFYSDSTLDVYGLSYESDSGIFVDNYAVRGSSGLPLVSIPDFVMKNINNYLQYDLVVLQFGVNVAAPEATNFDWYEKGMTDVVKHIQKNMPTADILIVSVGDRAYKKNMELVTQPSIPKLVNAQRNIARKNGIAFWNLYESMGGYNSMKEWANAKVPLANKDYTHFNYRGAEKIGSMLKNNLVSEYRIYKAIENFENSVAFTDPVKNKAIKSKEETAEINLKGFVPEKRKIQQVAEQKSNEQTAKPRSKNLGMIGTGRLHQ